MRDVALLWLPCLIGRPLQELDTAHAHVAAAELRRQKDAKREADAAAKQKPATEGAAAKPKPAAKAVPAHRLPSLSPLL